MLKKIDSIIKGSIISYELNKTNTLIYDEKEREEFIKHSLKNQF